MKKLITVLAMILFVVTAQAQLNKNAQKLKEKVNYRYKQIVLFAEKDWKGDHEMMIHVINKQSDALVEIFDCMEADDYDETLLAILLGKWSTTNIKDEVLYFDWEMVLYEYEKQLELKNKY